MLVSWAEPELGTKPWSRAGRCSCKLGWPCVGVLVSLGGAWGFFTLPHDPSSVPPPLCIAPYPRLSLLGVGGMGLNQARFRSYF